MSRVVAALDGEVEEPGDIKLARQPLLLPDQLIRLLLELEAAMVAAVGKGQQEALHLFPVRADFLQQFHHLVVAAVAAAIKMVLLAALVGAVV